MADLLNLSARPTPAPGARPAATPAAAAGSTLGAAPPADGLIKDGTDATFMVDVLEASKQVPVVIDLWAPWCGPCKTLGPMLERAVIAARGAVRLVKINVDENPELSRQLRVQSIPAVYAFKDGQPIDGFVGALPESQVKAFVDGLAGESGASPVEEILAAALAARESGDLQAAGELYGELIRLDPGNVAALAGLAQVYVNSGDDERALQTLALVPPDKHTDPAVRAVDAAIKLKAQAKAPNEIQSLEAKVAADATDHQARYDLAVALAAAGRREDAVDHLLTIIQRNRGWNEDAARKQLLTLFDAFGPKDEVTMYGRRRLSSILFA